MQMQLMEIILIQINIAKQIKIKLYITNELYF